MHFPTVTYKEMKILFLPSLRKKVEQLQDTAELLQSEADILEEEIEYLLDHESRFGNVEQELQEVARAQGSFNSKELVELVRENEVTMDYMRENLRQKVIQDVIGITIRSEKDSNQGIDRVEAKLLALKITVKLEAYGITFDEDKFLQVVALNPTLWGVAGTVRKLLPRDEKQVDDASLVSAATDMDDIYDMFYMSREDQQRRGSVLDARAVSEGRRASLALATRRQLAFESRHLSLARTRYSIRS